MRFLLITQNRNIKDTVERVLKRFSEGDEVIVISDVDEKIESGDELNRVFVDERLADIPKLRKLKKRFSNAKIVLISLYEDIEGSGRMNDILIDEVLPVEDLYNSIENHLMSGKNYITNPKIKKRFSINKII